MFRGTENGKKGRLQLALLISDNFAWADKNRVNIIESLLNGIGAPKPKSVKEIFSKIMTICLPMNLDIVERWVLEEIGFEKAWAEARARNRALWS
jgi:hypothetical protein